MKKFAMGMVEDRVLVEHECDICGRDLRETDENIMEAQEAVCVHMIGGYASVFGDGREINIDLCQHCFKEKLGNFCTII